MRKIRKFRQVAIVSLILVLSLIATGCGSNGASGQAAGGATSDGKSTGASTGSAAKVKIDLKLAGADPGAGGVWDLIGGGLASAIKKGIPDASITLQPGGGVSDVSIVSKSPAPALGLTHSVIGAAAEKGIDPFKEKITNVKAITSLYVTLQQVAVADNLPAQSVKELVEKKIPFKAAVDEPGSTQLLANQRMFAEAGATFEDIKKWGGKIYEKGQEEASSMLGDDQVNVFPIIGPAPQGPIMEVAATKKIRFLTIDSDLIDTLVNKYGYAKASIPKSAYSFMTEDYPTFASRVVLIANDAMSDDEAYAITKALVENIETLRSVHANLKNITPEMMAAETGIPLHPGALKYYKEIGAIK